MLLERLGPSMFDLGVPIEGRHRIQCEPASQLWTPVSELGDEISLPTGAEKAHWLANEIVAVWEELNQPCWERAIGHAVECTRSRRAAHDDERAFLVHGDVHQWNALQSDGGFKLVDPDGLLGEPEYDLGIIMGEDPLELMQDPNPRDRAHKLAAWTGLDAEAIWQWGVIERVSTGLLATKINLQPVGAQMLKAANTLAKES